MVKTLQMGSLAPKESLLADLGKVRGDLDSENEGGEKEEEEEEEEEDEGEVKEEEEEGGAEGGGEKERASPSKGLQALRDSEIDRLDRNLNGAKKGSPKKPKKGSPGR